LNYLVSAPVHIRRVLKAMKEGLGNKLMIGFYVLSSKLTEKDIHDFISCAKEISKKATIFLATDSDPIRERFKKAIDNIITRQSITVNNAEELAKSAFRDMLIDWWMLGESDSIVITQHSSFGETAAVRTKVSIYGLPAEQNGFITPPWCYKMAEDKPLLLIFVILVGEFLLIIVSACIYATRGSETKKKTTTTIIST